MHPVFRTQSEKDISERGRSRAPRDLEENSFESYDSFDSASDDIDIDTDDDGGGGDDDSYEPADSSAIKLDSTTEMEYESDDGSAAYSAASETDNAPVSTSEYSEDDDEYEEDEDVALITVNNNNSASEFLSSASESTDNDSPVDEDDFEDEMSDEYVPDDSFVTNNQDSDEYGSEEEDDNPSESDYGSEEEDQFDENDTGGHAVVSRRLADKADDDLFWKRYGYSQRVGNFEDEASNEYTPSGSSSGGDSDDDDDDGEGKGGDFDDGDTFKDELVAQAFPSLAVSDDEDSKKDTKRKLTGGTAELMARARGWFDCSSCLESEILKGKYKWYIIGGGIFFVLLVVVGVSMKFVLPSNKDNTEDDQQQQSTVPAVTTAPTTAPLAATLSPTLPEGQVGQPITFLAYVVDGKENNVTVESLEDELSGAFDVLAPQVLTNLTVAEADNNNSSNNNNNTSGRLRGRGLLREPLQGHSRGGLRGRHLRRELVATGVKLPVPVDVVERVCPDGVPDQDKNLCVIVAADIVLFTDDGTVVYDYDTAMQDAIEGDGLQAAVDAIGSNTTIVTLDADIETESPSVSLAPTVSPAPTSSANPTGSCYDIEKNCADWAESDQCNTNPDYMAFYCAKACGACETGSPTTPPPSSLPTTAPTAQSDGGGGTTEPGACVDANTGCSELGDDGSCLVTKCASWANGDECESNPGYMSSNCANTCNMCETMLPTDDSTNPVAGTDDDDDEAAPPTVSPAQQNCFDSRDKCPEWAAGNQCVSNAAWMLGNCKLSCDACESEDEGDDKTPPNPSCLDDNTGCPGWAADNQCVSNSVWMLDNCKFSCDACGGGGGDGNGGDQNPPASCVDDNTGCPGWAADNQCISNSVWMLANCKLSCDACDGGGSGDNSGDIVLSSCVDDNTGCPGWAADNQCVSNSVWMLENCKLSCDACEDETDSGGGVAGQLPSCEDDNDRCPEWAAENQCSTNADWMLANCKKSCDACRGATKSIKNQHTKFSSCVDGNDRCPEWAADDQCASNPVWMSENCKASCHAC